MKKLFMVLVILLGFIGITVSLGFCDNQPSSSDAARQQTEKHLDDILKGVDARYHTTGFSAAFVQTSTLKAMEITDTATGRIFAKHPAMMRWEYNMPEEQLIISDGMHLWVYRPGDNQVMVGTAPTFFSEGKGAGFLADIKALRDQFDISWNNRPLEEENTDDHYSLKLIPVTETPDVSEVHIKVLKKVFHIVEIATFNVYGDETRIKLNDIRFKKDLEDALFMFNIPNGVDVIQLDE